LHVAVGADHLHRRGLGRGQGAAGLSRPEAIIIVTNYPSDDYRTASRECGADHFFDKASEFHKVREVLIAIDGRDNSTPLQG
jgi:hypothetical protein